MDESVPNFASLVFRSYEFELSALAEIVDDFFSGFFVGK
jgi:hypothetical protein